MSEKNTLLETKHFLLFCNRPLLAWLQMQSEKLAVLPEKKEIQFGSNIHFQGSKHLIPRIEQKRDSVHNGGIITDRFRETSKNDSR